MLTMPTTPASAVERRPGAGVRRVRCGCVELGWLERRVQKMARLPAQSSGSWAKPAPSFRQLLLRTAMLGTARAGGTGENAGQPGLSWAPTLVPAGCFGRPIALDHAASSDPAPLLQHEVVFACSGDPEDGCLENGGAAVTAGHMGGSTLSTVTMTVELCAEACSSFLFFGLSAGRRCSCGDGITPSARVAPAECSTSCAGNRTQLCGGPATGARARYSVWANMPMDGRFTTYSRKPPPPPPPPCEDRLRLLVPWAADPCAQLLALGPFSTPGSKGARVAVGSQRPNSLAADIYTQDTCEECTAAGGKWQMVSQIAPCEPTCSFIDLPCYDGRPGGLACPGSRGEWAPSAHSPSLLPAAGEACVPDADPATGRGHTECNQDFGGSSWPCVDAAYPTCDGFQQGVGWGQCISVCPGLTRAAPAPGLVGPDGRPGLLDCDASVGR